MNKYLNFSRQMYNLGAEFLKYFQKFLVIDMNLESFILVIILQIDPFH